MSSNRNSVASLQNQAVRRNRGSRSKLESSSVNSEPLQLTHGTSDPFAQTLKTGALIQNWGSPDKDVDQCLKNVEHANANNDNLNIH